MRIAIAISLLFTSLLLMSQNDKTKSATAAEQPEVEEAAELIYKVVEVMPMFSGCEDLLDFQERKNCAHLKMVNFVQDNIIYPAQAKKDGIEGTLVAKFIIGKDGSIRDAKVVRDIGGDTAAEALRVINMMPNWIPGKQKGKPVAILYNLPIKFKLPVEKE